MREITKKGNIDLATDVAKSLNIKITLEQWPCTVTILGICATYAFVSWINQPAMSAEAD